MNIIDRRLNPKGKSLSNRRRFIRRAKQELVEAVHKATSERGISDLGGDEKLWVKTSRLKEPQIRHSPALGQRDYVLPGNKQYEEGDRLKRSSSQTGLGGRQASPHGEGDDGFQFALSQEEFLDIFFDDLELPDLLRKQMKSSDNFTPLRAGYAISGSLPNMNLTRTMRNSLARRIALKRPHPEKLAVFEAEIALLVESDDPDSVKKCAELSEQLAFHRIRNQRIPFIDPIDIRYNRFELIPQPVTSAVMFCLMDVSGSMTEHMKDLAKRFYKLLYLFLRRRYKDVDLVFIRHTHLAREVDEETFFFSTETGGTVVSTAFEEMLRVVEQRYPSNNWNIYAAQASDGDNVPSDNAKVVSLLKDVLLPACQYFAYIEVGHQDGMTQMTDLWRTYESLIRGGEPIAARKVNDRSQIFPVFRDLFTPQKKAK
jgi:uncharacterized sporulation protein YeaH/YhbH (DUF444 family)